MPDRRMMAAVDLGSNSFHMLVARIEHGEVRIIDRIREMVRLAAGLNEKGQLDEAVRQQALDCLERFGDRLREVPNDNIRAVGTQTFRRLRHPGSFLRAAEKALDCPIEIIGGREEARLIYTGVYSTVPRDERQRLVIDIGGGSTEMIIGNGPEPKLTESLQYGCVTVTRLFFSNDEINAKRWQKARAVLLGDLQELAQGYLAAGWQQAMGTSGTLRAISSVCVKAGWAESGITRPALNQLIEALIKSGKQKDFKLPGLSERRRPVFAGGVLVLDALCEALKIERMEVSDSALREGLLYDMLGRISHTDPRNTTIKAMAMRYGVDEQQAERVRETALYLFDQVATEWELRPPHRALLAWAADLHEVGLGISHSRYQEHSGYLISNSDMAGFSRLEQRFMAFLAQHHRRSIDEDWHEDMPRRLHDTAARVLAILRISVILHRARSSQPLPHLELVAKGKNLSLVLPADWLDQRPLVRRDMELESGILKAMSLQLRVRTSQHSSNERRLDASGHAS